MGHPLERVYKDRSLKKAAKHIMAYLVYRANDDGICWPGIATMQIDIDITENTRKKYMEMLVDGGYISILSHGLGRGNETCIEINPFYIKGIKFDPLYFNKRGQIKGVLFDEKASNLMPFETEKGSNLMEKGSNLKVEEQEEQEEKNKTMQNPIQRIVSAFENLTLLSPPHPSVTAYQDKWMQPLSKYLGFCDNDVPATIALIESAISTLRSNGNGRRYTIASPASLDTTISNLVSAKSITLDAGPDYAAEFDQFFAIAASRRTMRGTVPEAVIRVINQVGRGRFQSCTETGKDWLRKDYVRVAQQEQQVLA